MAQGHMSLSISPFLVIYANTSKSNGKHATSIQIEDQIVFDSNLAYLDHSLPPLGLFLQIKSEIEQDPKTPPFSHNYKFSPQETKFCNESILANQKF
jgi:hypothetical protein